MNQINVGVIGTGFAASSHIDALRRLPDVALRAIAGSSRAKAEAAAALYGIEGAADDYRALLEDPRIDAVHNCTPNNMHLEINAAVLEAGKHLLSEKPLASTSTDTARLVDAAGSVEAVTGVCFNYRHYPLVQQARAMVASEGGRPAHYVHGSYLQDWLLYDTDWNWRVDPAQGGRSRAVADIGSHWLDLVQHVASDAVIEVCADLATLHPDRYRPAADHHTFQAEADEAAERVPVETEDLASVLLRFKSGARGALSVSQVSAGRKNRLFFEIDSADGSVAWDQEEPNRLWIGSRKGANRQVLRDPGLLSEDAAALVHYPPGHEEGWPDGLRNCFFDFYSCIAARQRGDPYLPTFASFEDAHRVGVIVEAILDSGHSRRWTKVDPEEAGRP